jgi:GNAT superfamily N-acetyltransferase
MPSIEISPVRPDDLPVLLSFVRELAEYEKLEHLAVATEADFRQALFCERPTVEAVIARLGGEPAGCAIFFANFSTFLGKPGLYLEDLFVRPAARGAGVGRELLRYLARLAVARGWGRFEWAVLDWNAPAIGFYKKLGATPLDDWTIFRVTGDALKELAR